MNLRRLLIFLLCSACAFLLSLFGQQLPASGPTVLIVLPTSDPGQLAGWEHYRDPVRKLGYHLAVRTGEHPRVEISDPRGGVIAKYSGDMSSAFVLNVLASRPASVVDEVTVKANEANGDMGNAWLKANSAGTGPFVPDTVATNVAGPLR